MSDDVASTLTVAKLKALCILNDLATSGRKSELVKRLLESGLSNEEVGLPPAKETTEPVEAKTTPAEDEEVVLSLEDEDTLTPEVEPVKKTVKAPPEEDEVLEAEIAELEGIVADPAFYDRDVTEQTAQFEKISATQAKLDEALERWMELDTE